MTKEQMLEFSISISLTVGVTAFLGWYVTKIFRKLIAENKVDVFEAGVNLVGSCHATTSDRVGDSGATVAPTTG